MGSVKRKSVEESSDCAPPQKLQREDDDSTQIINEELVGCVHDVSFPENYLPPAPSSQGDNKPPAKEFPFTLDSFQSEAIKCLDNGESVMVSAHTSAGKTVVASYAIAMSLRENQRVIYTSPIKALSNQKYRDFKEEFSDVGLMTGDVTIDPNASCLVMTTEILRSMQYKGSEIMREVAWIIFDEVHYMRDSERGVVWEESIVMAPKNSRFVFLSATVPNAKEFADWVAKVHKQPCHIVYTDYRPTPLQHYVFPAGGSGLYLVVDEKAKFHEDSFQKSLNALVPANDGDKKRENGKSQKGLILGKLGEESDIFKLVKMIIQRQYDPVILFSFSKKECEALAMQMSKMDLNSDDEKDSVETIFTSAIDMLSDDDKKLPQVHKQPCRIGYTDYRPTQLQHYVFLVGGNGIYLVLDENAMFHEGSFQKSLNALVLANDGDIKRENGKSEKGLMVGRHGEERDIFKLVRMIIPVSLFSFSKEEREAFAMQVSKMDLHSDDEKDFVETIFNSTIDKNLPQVSSTFSILKPGTVHHSGLLPVLKELTEISFHGGVIKKMSGGADKRSICILMVDENMEPAAPKSILKGSADVLNRDFSLSKTMLLNQLRIESGDPENVLCCSFSQFQADRAIPDREKQVKLFLLPNRAVYLDCKNDGRKPQSFGTEEQDTKFNEFKSLSEGDGNRRLEDANYALDVLCICLVDRDDAGKKKIMPVPLKEHGDEPVVVSQINGCGACEGKKGLKSYEIMEILRQSS